MRLRKNNYLIIVEWIETGTEITTTLWLRINLILCSKGMETSGKSYQVPRWNYSEVIWNKIFGETTNHRLLVNLLSKTPWPSRQDLATKLHSRIWNFILMLLLLKRKNKHVRNWTRCTLLLEAQECWLTITRNFDSSGWFLFLSQAFPRDYWPQHCRSTQCKHIYVLPILLSS